MDKLNCTIRLAVTHMEVFGCDRGEIRKKRLLSTPRVSKGIVNMPNLLVNLICVSFEMSNFRSYVHLKVRLP